MKILNKFRLVLGVFFAAVLLCAPLSVSAAETYSYTEYSTEHGLVSNYVKDAAFDKKGFIWAATDEGIARYDGVNTVVVKNEAGQPIRYVKSLFVLNDDRILVAADSGFFIVSVKKQEFLTSELPGLTANTWGKFTFQDSSNNLWVGYSKGGINYLARANEKGIIKKFTVLSNVNVISKLLDAVELSTGDILFSHAGGVLYRWDKKTDTLVEIASDSSAKIADGFSSIKQFNDGTIWISDSLGVATLKITDNYYKVTRRWKIAQAVSAVETSTGALVGSISGLFKIDKINFQANRIQDSKIVNISTVTAGVFNQFLVSSDNGLTIMKVLPFDTAVSRPQRGEQTIAAYKDGIVALVGSNTAIGSEIFTFTTDALGNIISKQITDAISEAKSITVHDGNFWVSTSDGFIITYAPDGTRTSVISMPEDKNAHMIASCNGFVWVGYDNYKYDKSYVFSIDSQYVVKRWKFDDGIPSTPKFLRCVHDKLIVGSYSETFPLVQFDGKRFQPIVTQALVKNGLIGIHLNDIAEYVNSGFILATNKGLWKYSNLQLTEIDNKSEIGTSVIKSVSPIHAKENIWFGTNNGVAVTSTQGYTTIFGKMQGIGNPTTNYRSLVVDSNGTVWVSHLDGISKLNLSYKTSFMKPPIVELNGGDDGMFELSTNIVISATNAIYPAISNSYQYSVNSQDWVSQQAIAPIILKDLSPGNYKVEVKSRHGGYFWSEPTTLNFTVKSPWYNSPIGLLFFTTCLMTIVYSLFKMYDHLTARLKAEEDLKTTNLHLQHKNNKILLLLNNIRQGVFTINKDLIAGAEHSDACVTLLGQEPSGEFIGDIFRIDNKDKIDHFQNCVNDAIEEKTEFRKNLYLSLLPQEIYVNDKFLSTDYIPIEEGIMVALTDVTRQKQLADEIEREHRRMQIIISSVSDSATFFSLVDEFVKFKHDGWYPWKGKLNNLYRKIHTFKGSFNQLGFTEVPKHLHEAEEQIKYMKGMLDPINMLMRLFQQPWLQLLEKDLKVVSDALGEPFLARKAVIGLDANQTDNVVKLATEYLQKHPDADETIKQLTRLKHISLIQQLHSFIPYVQMLADKYGKGIRPMTVSGPDILLDPFKYRSLLDSLGHAVRNALDHGIELPELRVENGKDPTGSIDFKVSIQRENVTITLTDDGRGINEDHLRQVAKSAGWGTFADNASLVDLVCGDEISTQHMVTTTSGRGVGMAALRQVVESIDGSISIKTALGVGTTLTITFPVKNN